MLIWLAPVFVLGLVVFVHELGHFIAAKAFGVYAPRFSLGFGPAIVKKRIGETEYRIGILPIGGYVRMASRMDETGALLEGGGETAGGAAGGAALDPNDLIPFGSKPVPENRWFESKSLGARLVIMLAGVTMNLILGWTINVALVKTYEHVLTSRLSQVIAGNPAAAAGFEKGDSVVSVNGSPISSWEQFVEIVRRSSGAPVKVGVIRGTAPLTLTVTPTSDTATDPSTGAVVREGKIGVGATESSATVPLGRAIADGSTATLDMTTLVFTSLRKIATRETPVSDLGGPVLIVQASVQAARQGVSMLFYLIALLSVNLAVFNLLPIPILDGGQIAVQLVEATRDHPLSDRARENVARVGLALIITIFVMVTFNDIKRLIFGVVSGHSG
jgi:regulator of sigma E protease